MVIISTRWTLADSSVLVAAGSTSKDSMIGEVGSISVVVLGALGNAVVWACVKVFDMGRTSFDCHAFSIMEVR